MAWQKLIKFQKYARKIFMHIIYTYILTGAIHIYIYIHAHPINDEAFPTAPSTIRTRTRTPNATADAAASVSHSRQSSESSSRRVESPSPPHLLCTSSAPSLYLLRMQTMSSVCADCVASLAVELFTSQAKNQDRKPSAQWKSGPVVVVVVATAIVVVFYGQRLARIKSKNVSSFLCLPAKCKLAIKKPLSWSFLSLGCKVYNIYWFYLYYLIFHSVELLYLFIFNSFFYNLRLFSWRHLRLILYS